MNKTKLKPVPTQIAPHPAFDAPPNGFIDVGHSQLAHRKIGSGPDLLFVHGWPVHSATWRYIVPALSEHFTCHCIDLPGAGDTKFGKDSPIDIVTHAQTLRVATGKLGLSAYGIVAFDSGGAVSRYLADADDRVQAMVLSGTEIPGHHPALIARLQKLAKVPGFETVMRVLFSFRSVQTSGNGFAGCFADRGRIDDEFERRFITPLVKSGHAMWGAMQLLHTLRPHMTDDLRAVHGRLKMPVQLIWGSRDPYFPVDKARDMAQQFVNARFDVVDGARLFVHEEFAEEYVRLALPLLLRGCGKDLRAA